MINLPTPSLPAGLPLGSIPAGLKQNVKDIALARLLALTPFVGFIGKCVFLSSRNVVKTFEGLDRKVAANFAEHAVILGKPILEYTGDALDEFNIDMTFHGGLGIEPLTEFDNLNRMKQSGNPQTVFLSYRYEGKFVITAIEANETHYNKGRPIIMKFAVTLREYVESIPVEAEMKLREEELRRNETGVGGPERLAGAPAPTQARTLVPSSGGGINPITRMVT